MNDDLISRMSLRESILASLILGGEKTLDQIIDEEPSVDAVKVVRCKDCFYHGDFDENGYCVCECTGAGMPMDGFCSDGERKEK